MNSQWHKRYIQLAFRIEKLFRLQVEMPYIDFYYGPQEWKQEVQTEPEYSLLDLLRETASLLDALPAQGFEAQRTVYLGKQLDAMEMACRQLHGERFSLEETMRRLFDIEVQWTPEEQFEEALALYNEALPGKGTLASRLHEWRKAHGVSWEARDKLPRVIDTMLAEMHRRTVAKLELPPNEGIDLDIQHSDDFGGACWYMGNYRSRVEVNTTMIVQSQMHINELLDTLCHEVYPGHHTQYTLADRVLYQKKGYIEESIGLIFSPPATIAEGFATNARRMLFTPLEQEAWLADYVYPVLGIKADKADVEKIQRAAELLEGVPGNVVSMLHEGRSDNEIREYAASYMQNPDINFLKKPFCECFGIVEGYAKRLLGKHLQGADRWQVFYEMMTQQLYPSMLS